MDIHMRDTIRGLPVCWHGVLKHDAMMTSPNIDDVNCVECLRALVKDAVRYGRERKPKRQW